MRGAGTGGLTYDPAGAPSRAELTGLSDGPPSRGCSSFGSELDWNGARVPAPEGIALCRPVGPPKLERNTHPPFLCLPLSLPHLSPSAFFLSPPFHSPSLEGRKSGCRGKIWRQWELFSLESDSVEGIFGKLLFNISVLCLHPPPPAPSLPVPL